MNAHRAHHGNLAKSLDAGAIELNWGVGLVDENPVACRCGRNSECRSSRHGRRLRDLPIRIERML
jgi:hypothetical protein